MVNVDIADFSPKGKQERKFHTNAHLMLIVIDAKICLKL